MNKFKADFHIHSVLSPCGSLEMDPESILEKCKENGINLISITDHNSMKNSLVYREIAIKNGISYLFGMEIQTIEEIHLIALFDNWDSAKAFDKSIYKSLLPIDNDPTFFGDQVIIDNQCQILGFENKALINSVTLNVEQIFALVEEHNGFCFPAHVDAETFSILSQLGFIPEELNFTAIEISAKCDVNKLLEKFPYLDKFALIKNSDAHYLDQIGSGFSFFYMEEPSISEIKMACKNVNNRKIKIN